MIATVRKRSNRSEVTNVGCEEAAMRAGHPSARQAYRFTIGISVHIGLDFERLGGERQLMQALLAEC